MKKQTKQEKITKKQMSQAELKLQKEKIENKMLGVFAIALAAIMLLMYLYNWFQDYSNMFETARLAVKILLVVFLALMGYTAVKAILLKNKQENERSKKHWNWFFVCLAGFLGTFYVYPHDILINLFKIDPLNLTDFNNFHPLLADNGIQFRAALLMCGAGLYTIITFIYYGIKSAKLGKIKD